ncbi:flagellar brake protein [Methylohalobius crimeensis]|uniref:flagellar brake protein n=1 Tax=Methylohalobius crimeensis TaxID=244365 RepID=UPI000479938D|nr:flagellar brake protein [Methylohalobius crimeensis]
MSKHKLAGATDSRRFLLKSPTDIVRILRFLMQQRAIVTAHLDGGKTMLVTAVLLVDPKRKLLVLDYGPDSRVNQRVLASEKLFCISKLDRIEVKFTLHGISQARLEGQPAFRADLPETVYYPERRHFYRLTLPKTSPLSCIVKLKDDSEISLSVVDLGIGGIGLMDDRGEDALESGAIYPDSRLELPELGQANFDLEVCSIAGSRGQSGEKRRLCCTFHNLKPVDAALIQRYLNQQQIKLRQTTPDGR